MVIILTVLTGIGFWLYETPGHGASITHSPLARSEDLRPKQRALLEIPLPPFAVREPLRAQRSKLFVGDAPETQPMKSNSEWQNRLGTIRVAALGVIAVVVGIVWYIQH